MDLLRVAAAVHSDDTIGKAPQHLGVAARHRVLQGVTLALDAIGRVAASRRGLVQPQLDEQRPPGQAAVEGTRVELQDSVEAQPAGDTLVGQRRVDEAIANHRCPSGQRGGDHRAHQLGAGGAEQMRLGQRRRPLPGQQSLANALTDRRAAGLAGEHNLPVQCAEVRSQQRRLSALAAAVDALETNEATAHGPMLPVARLARWTFVALSETWICAITGRHMHLASCQSDERTRVSAATAMVTGGAGFIGSNLADEIVARGRRCHVVDNFSSGARANLNPDATVHEIDIRDGGALMAAVAEARPATIFHLAAQADVRKALEDPTFDAAVNVVGTINVLEAARAVGARVVFASTGGAGYGEYPELEVPSPESAETRPLSFYGMSKMAGEGYCGTYARLYGLDTVVLRLGNVYGPRQDPHGEAGVVAIFCGKLLDGDPPRVFGDGLQTRDYVFVGDVVQAFLAAETAPAGTLANIGCGEEVNVLDLIDGLGYEGDPSFEPAREGELQRSCLAVDHARAALGWEPRMRLRPGLEITLASVKRRRADPEGRPPGFRDVTADGEA